MAVFYVYTNEGDFIAAFANYALNKACMGVHVGLFKVSYQYDDFWVTEDWDGRGECPTMTRIQRF